MHIYIEMSQGKSLCSYLKQTKMSFFSFTKSENRKAEQILGGGGLLPVGGGKGGEMVKENEYGTNIVYICM
jgi:hypothetical protein